MNTQEIPEDHIKDIVDRRIEEKLQAQRQTRSRRTFLAQLAGAASVGAMGYHWVRPAKGAAVGQIGTSTDRVDVFAETLDVNSFDVGTLNADDLGVNTTSGITLQAAIEANGQDATGFGSLGTDSLVIGGKLYEEDDNSPLDAIGVSFTTFELSTSWDEVIIIPDNQTTGWDQLRVNDATSGYSYWNGSENTGESRWTIPRFPAECVQIHLKNDRDSAIRMSIPRAHHRSTLTTGGTLTDSNAVGDISQFSLSDSGSSGRTGKAHVFGRDMQL
jgi:hypothetical protein